MKGTDVADITDTPPAAPSWKDQRDKARADAYDTIAAELTKIAATEQNIDLTIVALHDELDATFTSIAERTGISVSIVRSRYEKAKG